MSQTLMLKPRRTKTQPSPARRGEPFPLNHVAIIMDGNRRWADLKGLPRLWGHKEGVKTLKELVKYVGANSLKYLTVYAFSSENWQRTSEEVNYLFELFGDVITNELGELNESNVRLRFLGQLSQMPDHLARSFENAMEKTKYNEGLSLQVAINYGSRLEITDAVRSIAKEVRDGRLTLETIDAETIGSYLYTKDIPDPDLIIRTGGEMRLSNYLLWQAAYAELYVTPVLWPAFTPQVFEQAISEFAQRVRRYGGD